MRKLNIINIREKKVCTQITSNEALKDIIPIDWSEPILKGTKKILVK